MFVYALLDTYECVYAYMFVLVCGNVCVHVWIACLCVYIYIYV